MPSSSSQVISQMEHISSAAEAIRRAAESTRERPQRPDETANLERAVDYAREVLEALAMRYSQTQALEDLNRIIEGTDKVLLVVPTDHPSRVIFLKNLSSDLGTRFEQMGTAGNIADINRSVQLVRLAIQEVSQEDPYRSIMPLNLSKSLQMRCKLTHNVDDLELAVEAAEKALEAIPDGSRDAALYLIQAATTYGDAFIHTRDPSALERAVKAAEAGVDVTPQAHPKKAMHVNCLARLLTMRFEQTAVSSDLDRVVDILSSSLPQLPRGHLDRIIGLDCLGIALGLRFEHQGDSRDLDDAIKWSGLALDEMPGHLDGARAARLSNLANRLFARAERTEQVHDLDHAIDYALQGLKLTPQGDPERARRLGNLGAFFAVRFRHEESGSDLEDLDQGIRFAKEAIASIGAADPELESFAITLANLLRYRFMRLNVIDDLNDGVDVLKQALRAVPANYSGRAHLQYCLGTTLCMRYTHREVAEDFHMLLAAFTEAWACKNARPWIRIDSAMSVGMILAEESKWEEGATHLHHAVDLLPVLSPRNLQNADKQHVLGEVSGLAPAAAAAALNAGKEASYALQLLELGRGMISGLLLDMRTDLSSLRQSHPALADEFERLRDRLDSAGSVDSMANSSEGMSSPSWGSEGSSRRRAEEQFQDILVKIRTQTTFKDFLLPPTADRLMEAADPGPVVVVNVSKFRCDAFLVDNKHQIRVQKLPSLTFSDVNSKGQQLRRNPASLASILAWLWDVCVHPILDALGFDHQPSSDDEWPHIWWIPVGPLSYFPLHAAGYHERCSGETALDRVISSYSSSIKSLLAGRLRQHTDQAAAANALLVSMPKTPGHSSLPFAEKEVAMLADLCPSLGLTPIKPPERRRDILDQLRTCSIFHFAGHGIVDPSEPSRSGLLLQDGDKVPLTAGDIREQKLQESRPFLAYLSACSTGASEVFELVDEAVHLVSACQIAGFRHVVGTLWVVSDMYCVEVAHRLYQTIRDEGMTDAAVCRGLHRALRELRDTQFYREDAGGRINNNSGRSVAAEQEDKTSQEEDDERKAAVAWSRGRDFFWVPYIHFGV